MLVEVNDGRREIDSTVMLCVCTRIALLPSDVTRESSYQTLFVCCLSSSPPIA